MSTIKNGRISLHRHFNNIIKGPGTSFQSPALSQKNVLKMFVILHISILPNFILIVLRIQKNKNKCNFHYVAMPMMTSQISNFVDFTQTQKSRHLRNEKIFFLQIKKMLITHQGLLYCKK